MIGHCCVVINNLCACRSLHGIFIFWGGGGGEYDLELLDVLRYWGNQGLRYFMYVDFLCFLLLLAFFFFVKIYVWSTDGQNGRSRCLLIVVYELICLFVGDGGLWWRCGLVCCHFVVYLAFGVIHDWSCLSRNSHFCACRSCLRFLVLLLFFK